MAQINKPNLHFNTVLFSGTGSAQSITGVGFRPDWVWIKPRDNGSWSHNLTDSVRGAGYGIFADLTGAEYNYGTGTNGSVRTFDSDGFSVGSATQVNNNSSNIVSWNWLAANGTASNSNGSTTSTVSANTTAGFSIVSWTGTGSATTLGHGLGATPQVVLVKNRSEVYGWQMYHIGYGANNKYLSINSTDALATDAASWNNTAPTSSVFSVGASDANNKSSNNIIAYCFAEKKGYSKFSTYTGNGSTNGPFIYCGFKPAWGIFKRTNSTGNWIMMDNKRSPFNEMQKNLFTNTDAAEDSSTSYNDFDFVSNGIKIREDNNDINADGSTYIYMAFAENPIVGSNNIPTTGK